MLAVVHGRRGPSDAGRFRIPGHCRLMTRFFRPLLLMPEGLIARLPHDRLRHVFLHELAHMKRHDVEAGWLLAVIQVLHWVNPLVWVAFRQFRGDRELACDAMALEHLGAEERGWAAMRPGTIRLSVGLEDVDDLIADLERGLAAAAGGG